MVKGSERDRKLALQLHVIEGKVGRLESFFLLT